MKNLQSSHLYNLNKIKHATSKISTLKLLEELTNIHSPTHDTKGVNEVQEYIKNILNKIGFSIQLYDNSKKTSGKCLVAIYPPKVAHNPKYITLVAHADTVGIKSESCSFSISEIKNRVFGPGVADNKAGIVVALEALKNFLYNNPTPNYGILFVCSPNEEEGSTGFQELFRIIGSRTHFALGMEPALQCGSIISSRNGNRWYKLSIKGISSHSGRFGEPHLNAAHELAHKVVQFHSLSNENEKVRVNIGSIEGGNGTYNTICGSTNVLLDTRFPCFKKRDKLHKSILEIIEQNSISCPYTEATPESSVLIEDDCPPLNYNEAHQALVHKYLNLTSKYESSSIKEAHSGGASDINYFSHTNNFVLDGLGAIGGKLHTDNEYIHLDSLYSRPLALALAEYLRYINSIEHYPSIGNSASVHEYKNKKEQPFTF